MAALGRPEYLPLHSVAATRSSGQDGRYLLSWKSRSISRSAKSWAVVTKSQLYGTAVYATAFAAVATLGVVFGRISATAMSYVVTGVYITMSIVVFANVIRACRSVPVASIADEV